MDDPQNTPETVPQFFTFGGVFVSEILQERSNSICEVNSFKSTRDYSAAWEELLVVRIIKDVVYPFFHSENAHPIRAVCCSENLPESDERESFMVPIAWLVPNDTPFAPFPF